MSLQWPAATFFANLEQSHAEYKTKAPAAAVVPAVNMAIRIASSAVNAPENAEERTKPMHKFAEERTIALQRMQLSRSSGPPAP